LDAAAVEGALTLIPTLTGYVRPDKPDERDNKFRVPRSLVRAGLERTSNYWIPGPNLDQKDKPHCVEYSGRGALACNPVKQVPPDPLGSIYAWCQRNDEWVGESYDGTSVHALMKWLKANGYISSYDWATSWQDVHAHLMLRGPVIAGTTWTWDMFTPDKWGYIRPTGGVAGGHAWYGRGGNINRKDPYKGAMGAARKRGSWGRNWGERGEAWITYPDIQILIDDYGEVALPIEIKRIF
jgi:hypothetical protein